MEKIALITGAARGLGLCLTKECLKRGYTVIALARTESEEIKKLSDSYQDRLIVYNADVMDYCAIKNASEKASVQFDHIDLIINCVGVWFDFERLPLDHERFDFHMILKEFDINSVGPLRVVREFLSLVKKSELKTIVNISSEAGSISMNNWRNSEYAYCMSKAALNMASKILENSYSKDGIKVYSVDPGWMKTDMGGPDAHLEPEESALDILNLVEGERKTFINCNRKGEEYEW